MAASPSPRVPAPTVLRSVRGRLLLLVLTLLITSALVAVVLLVDGARRHRDSTERQLAGTARALSLAVDGEIGQAVTLLRAMSASDELENGEWAAFDREARAALRGGNSWILVVDEQGRQLVNTSMPYGATLPSQMAPGFRERWAQLAARGQTISGLTRGRVFPGHIVVVDLLAVTSSGRRYDVAVVIKAEVLGHLIARQGLPSGWYGGVIDSNGVMIARNVDPVASVGRQATADMRERISRQDAGVFESVSMDGRPTLAAYNRSDLTGWTVAVAMPRDEGGGYLNRSLMLFLGASLGLILLGALLSLWLVRGTTRAVDALVEAAEGLGGAARMPAATGLWETDQIALALHDAGMRLSARETELRNLNETLEARVEEQASKLFQAQKLEAVGRMTGGIAHDFNNLLTAVMGNLDLLRRRLDGSPHLRFVTNAREAAERGARLTSQMLAFSRRQRLTPEPTDVNAVLEGMEDLLSSTLGGGVRVDMALATNLPPAMADRTQLELVVLNLALNARDASPADGRIGVRTAVSDVRDLPTAPEHPDPGTYVAIVVSDQGEGMSAEVLDRVFEPFFTTKASGRGSGLGLSQALGIVKQLGGGMELASSCGEGTTITLYLPIAGRRATRDAKPAAAPGDAPRGQNVLLVDDYPPLRAAARTMLEDLGCTVHDAESGEAALRMIEGGLQVRLAFVDYSMPGMTGVDLAARLSRLNPSITVILSSGYLDADEAVRAWTGPLLPKPYAIEDLARVLAEHSPAAAS